MSWETELVKFYDANEEHAGDYEFAALTGRLPMTPIFSKAVGASYEVSITAAGDFVAARSLDSKSESTSIITQQTADSQARTNDAIRKPAPFIDQIRFMAKNPEGINKQVKDKKNSKKIKIIPIEPDYYENYIAGLKKWAASEYSHPYVKALLTYLEKGTVITDIMAINGGVELDRSSIFRLVVDGKETWKDMEFHKIFQDYYMSTASDAVPCPVTGIVQPPLQGKAAKIQGQAKIFSSNDSSNYTYRGDRYPGEEYLPTIGAATEQKITVAYKWIKAYQQADGYVFWGLDNMAAPWADTSDVCKSYTCDDDDFDDDNEKAQEMNSCGQWAAAFARRMAGYAAKVPVGTNINIMRLDCPTTGRCSIASFCQESAEELCKAIENWHTRGAWQQVGYYGVPTPEKLIQAAQATNPSIDAKSNAYNKLMTKELIQGMLHNRRIPFGLVRLAALNLPKKAAAVPHNVKDPKKQDPRVSSIKDWEHNMLAPLCSLTAAYYNYGVKEKENYYTMILDRENTNRSYLFGRLLACAHKIESTDKNGKKHKTTNAMRLMNRFVSFPAMTWSMLVTKLQPYLVNSKNTDSKIEIESILTSFSTEEDFTAKKGLDPVWMLGYAAQLKFLFTSKKKDKKDADVNDDDKKNVKAIA